MEIKHYDAIGHMPALWLVERAWHALLEAGLGDDGATAAAWDDHLGALVVDLDHGAQAIVAFAGDETPIGLMTWSDQAWCNQVWINLAYVLPEHRRQGVHTAMLAALVEKARELNRPIIASGLSARNAGARAAMKAQGRVESAIVVHLRIPAS
jgi:GNAT superfamily N-acetyltransferase